MCLKSILEYYAEVTLKLIVLVRTKTELLLCSVVLVSLNLGHWLKGLFGVLRNGVQ